MDFLQQLEHTRFSLWVSHSGSIWSYPAILLLHTYGMAVLVGLVGAIDLRILGFAPALPLAPLQTFFPAIWTAFWVNAVSGTILLASEATTKLTNPDFGIKMVFIVLAALNLRLLQTRVFRGSDFARGLIPRHAKSLALMSLVCWIGAITAGRLLAYVH